MLTKEDVSYMDKGVYQYHNRIERLTFLDLSGDLQIKLKYFYEKYIGTQKNFEGLRHKKPCVKLMIKLNRFIIFPR